MTRLLEAGAEPIPGYQLVRYIGRGGFGEVWEAQAPGGLAKAIKLAPMEHGEAALNCRELEGLQKMRSIRHPYLLSIERFEVRDGFLVIVMELADRSLAERYNECINQGLHGIPREELFNYLREAAEVLDLMCNQHGLQHLDVKPENLFLSGGHIKVADFGLVQPRNSNMSRQALAISPPYAPPELFDGRVEPTCDQYSLAVTFMEMLTGCRPYQAQDVRELVLQHLRGRPDLSPLPPGDRPIVGRALQRDAGARFAGCTEFVAALRRASAFGAPATVDPVLRPVVETVPTVTFQKPDAMPATPMVAPVVRRHHLTEKSPDTTAPFKARTAPIDTRLIRNPLVDPAENRATFLAFLPLEIFAYKLRGFIDAMDAEILTCTEDKTVLRFGVKRWFSLKSAGGIFLEMFTYSRHPQSGYRLVDVHVWTNKRDVDPMDMARRALLLIRTLKAYLMAVDNKTPQLILSDAQLKAEIFG